MLFPQTMKKYLQFIYGYWAGIYDSYIDQLFSFDRKAVITALGLTPGAHVLEVGVGTGLNIPYYPSYVSISGIDLSGAMLKQAQKKKGHSMLYQMDAAQLAFKENTFDAALATYVLRVAPEPKAILDEVAMVTRPGARFVILDQLTGESLCSRIFSYMAAPLKLALGWGKDYSIDELFEGTHWEISEQKQFGKMGGTKLLVLKNSKIA